MYHPPHATTLFGRVLIIAVYIVTKINSGCTVVGKQTTYRSTLCRRVILNLIIFACDQGIIFFVTHVKFIIIVRKRERTTIIIGITTVIVDIRVCTPKHVIIGIGAFIALFTSVIAVIILSRITGNGIVFSRTLLMSFLEIV